MSIRQPLHASYALPTRTRFLGTLLTPESALFPGQKQGLQEAALVEFMRTAGVLLVNCRQHMQQRGSQSGMHVNWAVPTRFSHASYALPTRFLGTLLTPKSALSPWKARFPPAPVRITIGLVSCVGRAHTLLYAVPQADAGPAGPAA